MAALIYYDGYLCQPTKKKHVTFSLRYKNIKMQSYLSDPLHWPLGVHLKDATLCRARHSQLMPRVQANLLFTPASNSQSVKACPRGPPQPPNDENCFTI